MNKILLDLYDMITFPIAVIGWLWYFLIETPIFVGRMKAYTLLQDAVHKSQDNEGE